MDNFVKTLKSIISGSNNFCCLCFNIFDAKDLICSKDEVTFVQNNNNENIVISDLILTILGTDLTHYLETLDYVCESCTKSLINSYSFIQTCNSNATLLINALEGLSNGIQNITKPKAENSLFVSISLENFSSRFLYDHKTNLNPTSALKRYQILNTPKVKETKPKEKTNKYSMNDIDMLLDPSSQHIFQCKVCVKIYRSMSNLRNHYTRAHLEKRHTKNPKTYKKKVYSQNTERLTCNECGKSFKNLSTLKLHQMSHEMSIVCPDCGRTYKNNITFKNHIQLNICKQERRHSPSQGKYTCDYCNKKYTQKVSLRVHIQFEHGNYKAHICEWCGKKFWAQSRLKAHIVKHTRERNFTCPIFTCQRQFVTKESLLYHTRLHTGEKPYKCPQCSSRFLSSSRRSDHVRRYHDGAKPGLECDICHGKFRSGDVLLKHKSTHDEKINKAIISDIDTDPKMHTCIIHQVKVMEKTENVKRKFIDKDTGHDVLVDKYFVQNVVYLN